MHNPQPTITNEVVTSIGYDWNGSIPSRNRNFGIPVPDGIPEPDFLELLPVPAKPKPEFSFHEP